MAGELDPAEFSGRYSGLELIGSGANAAVFRAHDDLLNRTAAIKVPHRSAPSTDLFSEAQCHGSLSWHSNILSLYESGELSDGRPYYVMEYAAGGTLAELISGRGSLPFLLWRQIGREVASALSAAHESGVQHCDVKPSNILLASDGSARLADFGISRDSKGATTTIDGVAGSLAFAPPELFDFEPPSPASDIYSLAVSLIHAATGEIPYDADNISRDDLIARIQAGPPHVGIPDTPKEIQSLLRSAVSRQPEERPTAAEFAEALKEPPQSGPPTSKLNRKRMLLGVASIVAAAALLTTLVVTRENPAADAASPNEGNHDLCVGYETFVEKREGIFKGVSRLVEDSETPTAAIREIVQSYPKRFAEVTQPYLSTVRRRSPELPRLTDEQIQDLAIAGVLQEFNGGSWFLFDGDTGTYDPAQAPVAQQQAARTITEAVVVGTENCEVESDIGNTKAEMRLAIISTLTDPRFLAEFFADEESFDLLTADLLLMMGAIARVPFENLLVDHWDWLIELLDRSDEKARAIGGAHPDFLLKALREYPDGTVVAVANRWSDHIRAGLSRLGEAELTGIRAVYGDQLRLLSIDAS